MLSLNYPQERTVAVLHDILEDTDTTIEELIEEFPDSIVDAVITLSKSKAQDYNSYLKKVVKNPLALRVKRADISDNASPIRLYKLDPNKRVELRLKYAEALSFLDLNEKRS